MKWILLVTAFTLGIMVTGPYNQVKADGLQLGSVKGLWKLMAVMPAGVPSEETPDEISSSLCYWFHDDGTGQSRLARRFWRPPSHWQR